MVKMDWLPFASIADMPGRQFLGLYLFVCAVVIVMAWFSTRHLKGTSDNPMMVAAGGTAIIIGLGGYKIFVALSKGRSNVGFLVIMGILGIIILFSVCSSADESMGGDDDEWGERG